MVVGDGELFFAAELIRSRRRVSVEYLNDLEKNSAQLCANSLLTLR